uniref:Orotidine-5'-phosphate decarboxylase n=1 Tax=Chlorobium chlorochromatii (strain CaD3) TaxID=340177 RepID=Q3AUE6_CHLCH
MSNARNKANARLQSLQSLLCVGLDSDLAKIPEPFASLPNPVVAFNRSIIRATAAYAVAYKINTAFYEAYGIAGLQAMEETLAMIPDNCLSIADAKRGDIGNTSAMYAKAFFEHWNFDALTVAPYMGSDSLEPFFAYEEKLIFVLGLTSNAGSADFEEQRLQSGQPLYERVIERTRQWSRNGNGGVVVGATKSSQLAALRTEAPDLFMLIPGVGAQGGSLEEAVTCGVDAERQNAIINVSRALIYPPAPRASGFASVEEYEQTVSAIAMELAQSMKQALQG